MSSRNFLSIFGKGSLKLISLFLTKEPDRLLKLALGVDQYSLASICYLRFNQRIFFVDGKLTKELYDHNVCVHIDLENYSKEINSTIEGSKINCLMSLSGLLEIVQYSYDEYYDFLEGKLCKV